MFIDQARWLLEYHNRRNESLCQRAVALLGFTSVVIALVPATFTVPNKLTTSAPLFLSLYGTLGGLLITTAMCLLTLRAKKTGAPGIAQTRTLLREHTTGARRGHVHRDIAETLLHGLSAKASSPVDLAYFEANSRARWFRRAILALVLSLAFLASLIVQLFQQA